MPYTFEEWELNIKRCELHYAGQLVKLEPQVFSVLAYLVQHRDRVLSKQELLSHLWPEQHIGDSALERCIMEARKAVGDSGDRQCIIKTFHRRGYRFVVPVKEQESSSTSLVSTELATPPSHQLLRHNDADHAPLPPVALACDGEPKPAWETPEIPAHPVFAQRTVTVLSCAIAPASEAPKVATADSLPLYCKPLYDHLTSYLQIQEGVMIFYRNNGLTALFGLSAPYEDHALRAVRAAMTLQASLDKTPFGLDVLQLPLKLCMGLHSGDIIGRRFGDDPQRLYMAIGHTLQFAANLQTCTLPGVILASEATYRLVQHAVRGELAGLITFQSGLCHTTAYALSSSLTLSEPSPAASLSVLSTPD